MAAALQQHALVSKSPPASSHYHSAAQHTRGSGAQGVYTPLTAIAQTCRRLCCVVPCAGGTFNPNPGLTGPMAASCQACPAGSYCPSGSWQPTLCLPGYYCQANVSVGSACRAGTYGGSSRRGLQAQSDCYNCTTGAFCAGTGTPDPVPCSAGTYNSIMGGSGIASCLPCPAGYACPNAGTAVVSVLCPQGYFW